MKIYEDVLNIYEILLTEHATSVKKEYTFDVNVHNKCDMISETHLVHPAKK